MKKYMLIMAMALLAVGLSLKAEDKPAPTELPKSELPKPDADGWIVLFNGKDLTGWTGDPNIWRVVDGYISGKVDKVGYNTFLVFNYPLSNYTLEAKFILVDKKGNSGIQYRSKVHDPKKWIVGGYQADIGEGWWGALYEERGRGILFKPKTPPKIAPENGWNQFVFTANGPNIKHEVNGEVTGEYEEKDAVKGAKEGVIALQYHSPGGFEVRFKDIRIKLLEEKK
ncbi:MAG TPA: DUF1080 domain-containing protein [Planctomycetota bacterium]|nr:DUF1080 domain-containing protein [Planctomycetota bacterium]